VGWVGRGRARLRVGGGAADGPLVGTGRAVRDGAEHVGKDGGGGLGRIQNKIAFMIAGVFE
jgi:hypothetical protein